jgi:hypothetical protein
LKLRGGRESDLFTVVADFIRQTPLKPFEFQQHRRASRIFCSHSFVDFDNCIVNFVGGIE